MIPDEIRRMKPLTGKERLGANRESEYLGAEDIDPGTEPVLTIAAIYNGTVTLQRGKENKDVMTFVEERVPGIGNVRPLIVNATNRKTLRKLFGNVTADTLAGKRIQLYIDHNVRDPQDGSKTDGIRIKAKIPAAPKVIKCSDCGSALVPAWGMEVEQLAAYTEKNAGRVLCAKCAKKEADKAQTPAAAGKAPEGASEPPAEAQNETDAT